MGGGSVADHTCPCCGTPVRIVSSGEGTSYYEALAEEALRELVAEVRAQMPPDYVPAGKAKGVWAKVDAVLGKEAI